MEMEKLSFCTEVTEEDASNINGGAIQDISPELFNVFPDQPPVAWDPYSGQFYQFYYYQPDFGGY